MEARRGDAHGELRVAEGVAVRARAVELLPRQRVALVVHRLDLLPLALHGALPRREVLHARRHRCCLPRRARKVPRWACRACGSARIRFVFHNLFERSAPIGFLRVEPRIDPHRHSRTFARKDDSSESSQIAQTAELADWLPTIVGCKSSRRKLLPDGFTGPAGGSFQPCTVLVTRWVFSARNHRVRS